MIPKLTLPSESFGYALALGSGPSFDDYYLDNIDPDLTVLCGQAFKWRWTSHHVLSDVTTWSNHVIPYGFPSNLSVWAPPGGVLDYLTKLNSDHRPAHINEIPNVDKGLTSTCALSILAGLAISEKVFILGFDGVHNWRGQIRRKYHANKFIIPTDTLTYELSEAVNANVFNPLITRLYHGTLPRNRIFNMSACSSLFPLLPFPDGCASQPYGLWDRYASAIIIGVHPTGGVIPEIAFDLVRRRHALEPDRSPRTPIILYCSKDLLYPEDVDIGDYLHLRYMWRSQRYQFSTIQVIGLPEGQV